MCADPFDSPNTVRADAPGGSATVSLTPPRDWGHARLLVRSMDAAGNHSTPVYYEIVISSGEPLITLVGEQPKWGEQVTLRFAAARGVSDTVDFEYRVDDGDPRVVAAGPDGTATITFTVDNVYGHPVTVRSRSASGWVSPRGTSTRNCGPPSRRRSTPAATSPPVESESRGRSPSRPSRGPPRSPASRTPSPWTRS
ncbi:hypothetical protein [Actinokineospora sp.]|uniref:hypothetical protein n=1 Tax=Actinokineospora sp. TaxID=1872133 RepID=UPI003D6BEF72